MPLELSKESWTMIDSATLRKSNWYRLFKRQLLTVLGTHTTEGTGQKSLLLWSKPMTTITYRGVKYDAEQYKAKVLAEADQIRNHEMMYRGIKVERKFASKS